MSAKTKIVVLHLKELIYTGVFIVLGILFIVLLLIMFLPKDKSKVETETGTESETQTASDAIRTSYIPGVYTTSLVLSNQTVDVEVIVDEESITSIRLVNLSEAITTMYPLIQPTFESLTAQIYESQSLETVIYSDENKYTSLVLLDAMKTAIEKAAITMDVEEGILP